MPSISIWNYHLRNKEFVLSFILSLLFLVASLIINFYAGTYATESASSPVTDIILSNTRAYDVDGVFVYGSIAFWMFVFYLCLVLPNKVPFTVKSMALFIIIRSLFISLTHIGPFPEQAAITSDLLSKISFGGDLFFSGHTGLPFLLGLVFWQNKYLRVLFVSASVLFGIIVLISHLHYSIDVLSAFFITYSIFHLAEILFKKDRALFYKKYNSPLIPGDAI